MYTINKSNLFIVIPQAFLISNLVPILSNLCFSTPPSCTRASLIVSPQTALQTIDDVSFPMSLEVLRVFYKNSAECCPQTALSTHRLLGFLFDHRESCSQKRQFARSTRHTKVSLLVVFQGERELLASEENLMRPGTSWRETEK